MICQEEMEPVLPGEVVPEPEEVWVKKEDEDVWEVLNREQDLVGSVFAPIVVPRQIIKSALPASSSTVLNVEAV